MHRTNEGAADQGDVEPGHGKEVGQPHGGNRLALLVAKGGAIAENQGPGYACHFGCQAVVHPCANAGPGPIDASRPLRSADDCERGWVDPTRPAATAAWGREMRMGRRVSELGAGAKIRLDDDCASKRGRGRPDHLSGQLQTAGHGLPRP